MPASSPEQSGPLVPPRDPLVPANFDGWFNKIVGVIRRSFVPLLAIQIGVTVANVIFELIVRQLTLNAFASDVGLFMTQFIVTTYAQAASIFIAIRDAAGESTRVGAMLKFAAVRVLPLLGLSIVTAAMMGAGFLLFIVPGIYLAIVFIATLTGVVAVERKSISRCFQLVNRRFWPTASRMLFSFLIAIIYLAVIVVIVYAATQNSVSVATTVLSHILAIPFGIAVVPITLVTYAELRFHENPDVLTPTLAAELHR